MNAERNIIMKLRESISPKYKVGDIVEFYTGVGSDKLHGIIVEFGAKDFGNRDRSDAKEWCRIYTRVSDLSGYTRDIHPSRIVRKLRTVKIAGTVDTGAGNKDEEFSTDAYVFRGGRVEDERLTGKEYILKKAKQRISGAKNVYSLHYIKN